MDHHANWYPGKDQMEARIADEVGNATAFARSMAERNARNAASEVASLRRDIVDLGHAVEAIFRRLDDIEQRVFKDDAT